MHPTLTSISVIAFCKDCNAIMEWTLFSVERRATIHNYDVLMLNKFSLIVSLYNLGHPGQIKTAGFVSCPDQTNSKSLVHACSQAVQVNQSIAIWIQ